MLRRDPADIVGCALRAVETARSRTAVRHAHEAVLLLTDGLTPDQRRGRSRSLRGHGSTGPVRRRCGSGRARVDGHAHVRRGHGPARRHPRGVVEQPATARGQRRARLAPRGRPMLVTRADGTIVRELDGGPALPAYLAELPETISPEDPEFFYRVIGYPGRRPERTRPLRRPPAPCVPAGRRGPQLQHRVLRSQHPPGHGLRSRVAAGRRPGGGRRTAAELPEPPRLALAFSCASRVPLLGPRLADEAQTISDELGGAAVCGFFTFGEFARVDGSSGVHNSSVALLVI